MKYAGWVGGGIALVLVLVFALRDEVDVPARVGTAEEAAPEALEENRAAPEAASSEATASKHAAKVAASPSQAPATLDDDVPAVDQLPVLEARARQGDTRAACLLGAALAHCLRAEGMRPPIMSADYIAGQPPEQQARFTEMSARIAARFDRTAAACAGVQREQHALPALQHLLLAAQRGSTAARAEFLKFPIGVADVMQTPELGRLYAAHARRLFTAMWEEGDVRAIEVLMQAAPSAPGVQRPAQLAVPPELRNQQLGRDLNRHLMQAFTGRTPNLPQGGPGYHAPPVDATITAQAQRHWDERFANSRQLAEWRAAQQAKNLTRLEKLPVFPRDCEYD